MNTLCKPSLSESVVFLSRPRGVIGLHALSCAKDFILREEEKEEEDVVAVVVVAAAVVANRVALVKTTKSKNHQGYGSAIHCT